MKFKKMDKTFRQETVEATGGVEREEAFALKITSAPTEAFPKESSKQKSTEPVPP